MNLRNRPFEKRVRRQVRARLRSSLVEWREYRRGMRGRSYHVPPWIGRVFIIAVLATLANTTFRSLGSIVGIAVFWAIASAALRASQLLIALRSSPRLPVLLHLPISNEQTFQILWRGFLKTSLWSVVDFAAIYTVLAMRVGFGDNSIWLALGMALVQWTGVVVVAVLLVAYASKGVFRQARFLLVIPVIAWLAGGRSMQGAAESLAAFGFWLPPTGWTFYALGVSPEAGLLVNWWPAISMAAMLLVLPQAFRNLRRGYVPPEIAADSESARGVVEIARRRQSTDTEDDPFVELKNAIRTREFLAGFNWKRAGFLERIVSRWLTPQQRLVIEFMTAARPRWTRRTTMVVAALCGFAAFVYFIPGVVHVLMPFAIGGTFFAVNYLTRDWPGTALCQVSGSISSMFSVYPIGFGQIAGAIIKVNLARTLLCAPLMVVVGMLMTRAFGMAPAVGAIVVMKFFVLLVAYDLLVPIFMTSPGTTDTRSFVLAIVIVLAVVIIGGCGVTLFMANGILAAIAGTVLLGSAVAMLKVYDHAYGYNWFDLQRKPDFKQVAPKRI